MNKFKKIGLLVVLAVGLGTSQVKADENLGENDNKFEPRTAVIMDPGYGTSGCWKYLYTIEPYSHYQNTKTGEIRFLQTTSTLNHTVNTIIGGWATHSPNYTVPVYRPEFKNLMGGCP